MGLKIFGRKMGKQQKAGIEALAAGIECGAALRPQAFETLSKYTFVDDSQERQWCTCALGAALECKLLENPDYADEDARMHAVNTDHYNYDEILELYGAPTRPLTQFRLDGDEFEGLGEVFRRFDTSDDLANLIWTLNDRAKWSREQIAAFLRTLE